jgi:hypothetical protein
MKRNAVFGRLKPLQQLPKVGLRRLHAQTILCLRNVLRLLPSAPFAEFTRSGFPFPSSLFPLPFSLCLLLSADRANAVDIEAMVGFGQGAPATARYRPDTWTPLTVFLTGQGVRGQGQLQVTVRVGDHATTYTRRVSLQEVPNLNEAESFVLQLRPPNGGGMMRGGVSTDITVRLLVEGRKLAEKRVALPTPIPAEIFNLLALTRDGNGFNFLAGKRLGLFHRHFNPANYAGYLSRAGRANLRPPAGTSDASHVLYTVPSALPAMPQGYEMVDAIALSDQPIETLKEDQVVAIKGYVRQGGLLIVSGGGDLPRLKSSFYAEMLPIVPTGTRLVHNLPDLQQRYRQPLALPEAIALTEGTLKQDAHPLFREAGQPMPLISARPYGSGIVVFTTFDFLDSNLRSWRGAPSLWYDLLRCGNENISPRGLLAANAQYIRGGTQMLGDALAGRQAASTPGLWIVALFIGAYIVLLVPVSYLILKRLDKREFAWVTAPLLILGFTAASYILALSIKGGLLTVNRAVILESVANSDQVAGYAQMTLYSPRRAAYDIGLGDPSDPDNPYRLLIPGESFLANLQALAGDLTIEHDTTTTIRGAEVRLWDKRSFETPVAVQLGGGIQVQTRIVGPPVPISEEPQKDGEEQQNPRDRPTVEATVTNRTLYALQDCALIAGGQVSPIGSLAPGETRKQTLRWTYRGSGNGIFLPSNAGAPSNELPDSQAKDTPESQQARIRYAMTQTLAVNNSQGYGYYGGDTTGSYGRAVNAFVGWFYDPLVPVRVDGRPARGEEVNLLFVHLPVPANASPALLAYSNPFARAPARNLDAKQDPPGESGQPGMPR